MIILDTNIISELMKKGVDTRVLAWVDRLDAADVFTTAVTQAEISYGIAILPAGRKRDALSVDAAFVFSNSLFNRVLPFDAVAAGHFAIIASNRRAMGRPISTADAQIAAIAKSVGAIIATRNIVDFEFCGIELVNPWQ